MNCVKGTCPNTNNDPKITVTILDQENGTLWGFYCNHECALKDMGGALLHLVKGGDMASVPDPTTEGEAGQSLAQAVENPAAQMAPMGSMPAPAPTNLSPGFTFPVVDEGWDPSQAVLNNLADEISKTLQGKVKAHGTVTVDAAGKKSQALGIGSSMGTFHIRMAGGFIVVDLGNEDYNATLPPSQIQGPQEISQLTMHIKAVLEQIKIGANTPNF